MERIDAVINLATYYRKFDLYEDIDKMVDSNIKFPTQLLQLCKEHNIPIFVTAGSYFQHEINYKSINGSNSAVPRDFYAATKNAFERIMEYYSSNGNIKTVELVLSTPYGEMDHDEKLIPYVIRQALRNRPVKLSQGFQRLNLVYVEDVASAFVSALDLSAGGSSGNPIIDIANDKSYSIRDIVEIIENLLEMHIDANWNSLHTGKIDLVAELTIDNSRSQEILNWKPKVDIYEGLRRTIEYYKGEIIGN
jgi:nucleoside-diphosphate-sugar epimerase